MRETKKKKMGRPLISDAPTKPYGIRLTDEEIKQVEKIAKKKNMSRAQLLRELIISQIKV